MRGILFGIGTGPGDPELLTLKAISTMEKCDVIALPNSGNNEKVAFKIVEKYLAGKELLECNFSMEKDEEKRKALRAETADLICEVLEEGKNVGFVTLGDPTVYSTYMYVHRLVTERGFETKIIPGIPSFIAASAALNNSLCEGNEMLHIIPASDNENLDEVLNFSGTKVIMKSGKSMKNVISAIEENDISANVRVVERCTMDGERIIEDIGELKNNDQTEYFSVLIVRD